MSFIKELKHCNALKVIEVFRLEDEILVKAWDQYDRLHLMEQIGAGDVI